MLWKKVLKQQIKVGQKVKDGKSKEKAQLRSPRSWQKSNIHVNRGFGARESDSGQILPR